MPLNLFIKLFIFFTILCLSNSQYQYFQVQPHDISALIGSNITIPCVITSPHGDVQWTKDGLALGYDRQLAAFPSWSIIGDENRGEFNFFIESLKFEDEGIYACEVSPYNNAPALKQVANIKTLVRPEHVKIINNQSLSNETTIIRMRFDEKTHRINCRVDGARPAAHIKWINETGHEFSAISRTFIKDNLFSTMSTLTLIPSLLLHKKRFMCDVRHETLINHTNILRSVFEIEITSPPDIPIIHGYSSTFRLINDSSLTLSCQSYGGHPLDGIADNIDESQQRNFSLTFQFSKRKSSLRRILRNPVRRLSLKDNSTSKDVKTADSQDLIATSTTTISTNSGNDISVNKRQPLSSNSSGSRKVKNSINKSIGNGDVNDIYKMTESSSSPSNVMTIISPRNNLENDIIEIPSSFDMQSQHTSSTDTNIDFSPAVIVRKLVNTLALESSRGNRGDLSSRLRKTRVPPLTSISPLEDNSVIARLVQHVAPINIVSGLSASDFQIPAALSVTTPATDDTSLDSLPSSTITVIPNDSQSEQTDEISLNDTDQTTLSSLTTTDEPVDARTKYGAKRRHNIIELIETEKEYVKDLALIVEGYMNVIENDKDLKKPTGLGGRERVVFGNVQRIYEFHRDTFLPQLEQCIENPNTLGRLFTTNRFSPYVRYCENKPRSEYIVSEYHDYFEDIRKKLGQKLLVSDLLIKPVQRIMRYQLLLKEILKSTERMGDESRAIRSALQVMIEVPQQANDMMNVGRIKDLPTNVHQLGELKLQDMLSVSDPISSKESKDIEKKFKERRVFLFQQSMIFCDEIPAKDKYSSPNYIYKYELKINKLQHKEFKRNKELFQFTLVELDAGNTRRVICQCKDDEQYELWVTNVNKVLQRQMDLIIALTNPTAALQKDPRSK
ncbi:unnamed protein product [Rotaria sp. Silwood2]|nr:unnamed protein product [Rotaria sp. Silwood2]